MNKLKKIEKKVFMLVVCLVLVCQNVFAAELSDIYDVRVENNTYTASQSADIIYPYVRAMTGKMVLDKNAGKSGINVSKDKIEVTSTNTGVQVYISATEVIFSGKVSQAIIVAPKITINGEATDTLVAIGKDVDVNTAAKINDLVLKSGNTNMNGSISGNVLGSSTKIDIKGTIAKALRINTQRIDVLANKINEEVVIDTYNPALTVKYAYPQAKINVLAKKVKLTKAEIKEKIIDEIKSILIAVLSFGLIFLLVRAMLDKDKIKNVANIVKKNILFTIAMGVLATLLAPIDIAILVFVILAGIKQIGVSALLVYVTFLVMMYLLAPFITGTLIFAMVKKSFVYERKEIAKDVAIALTIFLILYSLTKIPVAGIVFNVIYLIFTLGVVVTLIAKKIEKNI